MAKFEDALPTIFLHEGRYVDHKDDPGGATNYGISLRFLKTVGDIDKDGWPDGDINKDGTINTEDIKLLKIDQAANIYRVMFWEKYGYEQIGDQDIATKTIDLAINIGSTGAHKIVQRAVRSAIGLRLPEDGILGIKSFTAINMCEPKQLLSAIKSEAAGYYRSIKYKGSQNFLTGWLNRAYASPFTPK